METPPHAVSRSRSCSPDSAASSPTNAEDYRTNQGVLQSADSGAQTRQNQVSTVLLRCVPIVSLFIDGKERLCLAQISNTLLRDYSYNEIHNRRVALGITCIQCTPVQLEILRRAGAMPVSSRRCGMITKREAERLVKSFLEEIAPPKLPENFAFDVVHTCGWGCRGFFMPSRYNSSRAKCIKCYYCNIFFSPNKFIFHCHRTPTSSYRPPDAANFNSWRRHVVLTEKTPGDDLAYAWEDVKAMFNGGSRKRVVSGGGGEVAEISSSRPTEDEDQSIELKRPCLESVPALPSRASYPYHIFPLGTPNYGFYGNFFQRQTSSQHPAFPYLPLERQNFGHAAGGAATMPPSPQTAERCKFNMADILRGTTAVSPYSIFWEKNLENRQLNYHHYPLKNDSSKKSPQKYLTPSNWSPGSTSPRDNKADIVKDFSLKNRNSHQQQSKRSSAFKSVSEIAISDCEQLTPNLTEEQNTPKPEPTPEDLSTPTVNADVRGQENITELEEKPTVEVPSQRVENGEETVSEPDENCKSEKFRDEIQRLIKLREKADHDYQILKESMCHSDMKAEDVKTKLSEAQMALREFAARVDAIKGISSINKI